MHNLAAARAVSDLIFATLTEPIELAGRLRTEREEICSPKACTPPTA